MNRNFNEEELRRQLEEQLVAETEPEMTPSPLAGIQSPQAPEMGPAMARNPHTEAQRGRFQGIGQAFRENNPFHRAEPEPTGPAPLEMSRDEWNTYDGAIEQLHERLRREEEEAAGQPPQARFPQLSRTLKG